jgi:hypothetical protein
MGRKSRAKRERRDQKEKASFHITIGAAPHNNSVTSRNSVVSLHHEIQLVKAALLYADKATLFSLSTSYLAMILALGNLNLEQKVDFLLEIMPTINPEVDVNKLRKTFSLLNIGIRNKNILSPELLLTVLDFESQIETLWQPAMEQLQNMAKLAGSDEIDRAMASGLLEVSVLNNQNNQSSIIDVADLAKGKSTDPMLIQYLNAIAKAVIEDDTYPLFDKLTGEFIRTAVIEDRLKITETRSLRGKQALLAGNLLNRLPLFEEASVDEIIDIRKELAKPLVNFRRVIIDFSREMKNASWDKDFPIEADQVFHSKIAPAVLEIEQSVQESRSLANFGARLLTKPIVVTGSTLAVVISQAVALPEIAATSFALGGLAAAATSTLLEYREIQKERLKLEQNHLFFYYRAGEILKNNVK